MIEKGETAIRSWKKELLGFVCCLLALVIFCAGASAVVLPKRYDYGSTWDMYLKEEEDTIDVMFFGSSLAYCDVVPATIYQETGITSYVMAGPEQTMPIPYRYLRQAGKTQSPKAVFIEVSGMLYAKHNRSTKINICYMPWSLDRLALTFQVADPDEWPGLLFPLYSYHSRWTELTWQEVGEGLFGYGPDDLAGYTFLEQVYPVTAFTQRDMGSHPEAYQQSLQAVEDILAFCEEEGIRAVFYLAPTAEPLTGEELSRLETDLAARGGELWDCNQDVDALGLDLSVDFFDADHFNYRGAEKFSRYLGEHLLSLGLAPTEGEDEALWQQRVEHFNTLRDEADEKPIQLSGAALQQ